MHQKSNSAPVLVNYGTPDEALDVKTQHRLLPGGTAGFENLLMYRDRQGTEKHARGSYFITGVRHGHKEETGELVRLTAGEADAVFFTLVKDGRKMGLQHSEDRTITGRRREDIKTVDMFQTRTA